MTESTAPDPTAPVFPDALAQTEVTDRVRAVLPGVLDDLCDLVRIPSISSMPSHDADVLAAGQRVADLLTQAGCPSVTMVEAGGKPAVIGHYPAPEGAPTVCLYAHYDVQPTGRPDGWTTDPFTPQVRDGRLFGRGSADDKGGFAAHLAALRAFDGKPPVGVIVFVEGEEEVGSPSLSAMFDRFSDQLEADVYVIADSNNWDTDEPAFTTTLRGLVDLVVEVQTLQAPVHSGIFGGPVPDALTTLVRLLATLVDDEGGNAVQGLVTGKVADLDYPEDRFRREAGVLDGVELIGSGSIVERLWARPTITVLAIDAPSVADASNTLQPSARAKISVRVPAEQRPDEALEKVKQHLLDHVPAGARVSFSSEGTGSGSVIAFEGERAEAARHAWRSAWGKDPVFIGIGGSIPMVNDFATHFPEATVLVTAVGDPDAMMHGFDESLHLGDFARAALAETLLLHDLAQESSSATR